MKLPTLSIATKLYLIFALLATVTVALASITVINARRHAALTEEFGSAFAGAMNVERVNALIYAVVMESRGIYMSYDIPTAKIYGDGLLVFNDRIGEVVKEWQHSVQRRGPGAVRSFRPAHPPIPGVPARAGAPRRSRSARRPAANGATMTPTAACARRSTRTSPGLAHFTPRARSASMRRSTTASAGRPGSPA